MGNDVLISELKTVFLYRPQFLRYSKIKLFPPTCALFARLKNSFFFKTRFKHSKPYRTVHMQILMPKKLEKKSMYTKLQGQIGQNLRKITPTFKI